MWTYDVFLSFRGVDTRLSFVDHLYKALEDANLKTFLEQGPETQQELESAIKASRVSVIVLSPNYATSSWCLDELAMILEQHNKSKHYVIPIFYHVDPIHIRKQDSFAETETNAGQNFDRWHKALTQLSDLGGKDAQGRLETELIDDIIMDIKHQLGVPLGRLPDLIGVDHSVRLITSWLKDGSTSILNICGMGGIGKTSLAKHIYGLHTHLFQRSSFIHDITRECAQRPNKLLDLQKKLCADISIKTTSVPLFDDDDHDVSVYTSMIDNTLAHKTVLLVLDDISSLDQLNALLGDTGFHPGCKIIITTKDTSLSEMYQQCNLIVQPPLTTYFLKGLNETSSLKLLSCHAFNNIRPKEAYKQVSKKLVNHCGGLPLALKLLGRSLYDQDVAEWEEYLKGLNKQVDSHIRKVLHISFDSLPSQNDKELFKHIACFFVGMDRDYTETILKACGIRTVTGMSNLIDRCLITIGQRNTLMMHELIQEMGRDVVRRESPDKPWKRSRLWHHEDSFNVLKHKRGKGNLKGIILDMKMLEKDKIYGSLELRTDALSKMDNLMLLQLNYVQLSGSYTKFPKNIRWLCMHGFPSKYIPSDLPMGNLVALDLSYSNLESFEVTGSNLESFGMSYSSNMQRPSKRRKLIGSSYSQDKCLLGSLKILNLSFCYQLHSVGGFSRLPTLERLILTRCKRLIEICESVEQCVELVHIDLSYCYNLKNLPKSIVKLKKGLLLDGCFSVNRIEAISRDLKSLTVSLTSSLVRLSLVNINLSNESFPMDFSSLSMLKVLHLDSNPIVSLPSAVRSLPRLKKLSLINCKNLESILHPPSTLRQLILKPYTWSSNYKHLLQKIAFYPEMSPLELSVPLYLFAPSSCEIQGMVKIQPIRGVEEKILRGLGWTNVEFIKKRRVGTHHLFRGSEASKIQMYYEFGIFSTIYGGKAIPDWISHRSKGPSMSFTMPSFSNKLRGLNICYMQTFQNPYDELFHLPLIRISNITKNHIWIYRHFIKSVSVGGDCLIFVSHWMFGMNEMEGGDHIIVTVTEEHNQLTSECGVSFVYDDVSTQEEEEDVLGYYKSWNHIIGGDLSAFQTTTGEFILDIMRFTWFSCKIGSYYRPFIADGASYKEDEVRFRAFSQRKSGLLLTPKPFSHHMKKSHTQQTMFSSKFCFKDVTK